MAFRTGLRVLPLAVLAALALFAVAGAGTASAKTCGVKNSDYPGDGYFTGLTATGTSCKQAKKVAREHYRCRVRNGGRKGKCKKQVLGYSCTEKRGASTDAEFNAAVTCKKSSARVKFTYQQNL